MAYCGEHIAVKATGKEITAVSLRCKSWLCPDCTDTRKAGLIANGIAGQPNKFITLTSRRRKGITEEQAARDLSRAWRLCRLRLMRRYKLKQLPFLAVVERHVSGWPHLHLLYRGPFLSQKLISKWMAELCDGPIVHIKALDNPGRAAAYCAKYCSKCVQKIGSAKRYWQSRDYDLRDPEERGEKKKGQSGWQMETQRLIDKIRVWELNGFAIKRESAWVARAIIPEERPPP